MVDEAESILTNPARPLADLGRLLHESWQFEARARDSVSNSHIDEIYEAARGAGAIAAAAGAGGAASWPSTPSRETAGRHRRARPVDPCAGGRRRAGSRIIIYEPDGQAED